VFVKAGKAWGSDRYGMAKTGRGYTGRHGDLIERLAADPLAAAAAYGRDTGECGICHRELTNPESVAAGIGPICRSRF